MTRTVDSARDAVEFLKEQHEEIKRRFTEVSEASGEQRESAFLELRRLLAVHETAEEEIVHPRAERELENGHDIVAARLAEENEAKKTLANLEQLDVDSAEFETAFAAFRDDVLAHAEAEESQEFAKLQQELDADELQKMRSAVKMAESMAPTRPHPGVESRAANLAAGPFAMMLDRARDAIKGKG